MKPIIIIILFVCFASGVKAKVVLYPAPKQELESKDFSMSVNDQPVFVYQSRVSKYPINQVWPGYQRPVNQTELASFAYFDFSGKINVKIVSQAPIQTLDIRPKLFGIKPVIKGNTVSFTLSKPQHIIVEVNGYHRALHVFTNAVEKSEIMKDDPKVHYFGPGIHEAGRIRVKDGETVFHCGRSHCLWFNRKHQYAKY